MARLGSWLKARFPYEELLGKSHYVPNNLNIMYCFGALAILVLVNQLLTGVWLSMFYTPTPKEAFASIQLIMRDVNYGWLFRHMHTTGASALYIVLYLHIYRSFLYGSYKKPRELVWLLGMLLFLVVVAESTFGYLLPWGQMSYWSMQVISSIFSIIPYFGEKIVIWIRGDYMVSGVTLLRCYALHIIGMPFLMLLLVILHIKALHHVGSNNPTGIDLDKSDPNFKLIPFYPKYLLKDLSVALFFLVIFFGIVFYLPDMGGYFLEINNYHIANTLQSPEDIRPLWYLLPFYGILKAIPNKVIGVMLMFGSLVILFFLPWLDKSSVRAMRDKSIASKIGFWCFVVSFIVLGYFSAHDNYPYSLVIARFCVFLYFASILLMPIYSQDTVKC